MRTVVTFLIIIDMIVMQRLNTEACEASSEESRREGIMAWGVTGNSWNYSHPHPHTQRQILLTLEIF